MKTIPQAKLRPFQRAAVRALPSLLQQHRRVIAVAPTGSGKTTVAAALVKRTKGRVLWLAHRVELLRQARSHLVASGIPARDVGIVSGVETENADARVVIASIGSAHRAGFDDAALVIVDEAHRSAAAQYQAALATQRNATVLGLTASPVRLDGQSMRDTFAEMLVMIGMHDAIAKGFIVAPRTFGVPRDKRASIVRGLTSSAGDYAPGKLARAMMADALLSEVVDECDRLAPGATTICYAVNREHGTALTARFARNGHAVAYVDGDTPSDERAEILAGLVHTPGFVVVNVDVLTEGFDCPTVKCVSMARPTKSLTRYLQMVGRASRPYKRQRPILLDHVGNAYEHGRPEDERAWTLDGVERVGGDAPVKSCVKCSEYIPAGARACPVCGAEQPRSAKELDDERVRLEELREAARRRAVLERIAKERGAPDGWAREREQALDAITW